MLEVTSKTYPDRDVIAAKKGRYKHLEVVCCHIPHNECHPWVTWLFNTSFKGFVHGNYFETREEAMADFADRD